MSSSSPNACTQASAPLVDGIVNHVLLQSGPDLNQSLSQLVHVLHFFLVDAILHYSTNLVIYLVEIWAIRRPQIRWDKCRRLPLQQLDCLVCPVRGAMSVSRWNISQGSVAAHLRWGGIFINNFIAQFQLSMSVKELWKSANISKDMDKSIVSPFFWLTV